MEKDLLRHCPCFCQATALPAATPYFPLSSHFSHSTLHGQCHWDETWVWFCSKLSPTYFIHPNQHATHKLTHAIAHTFHGSSERNLGGRALINLYSPYPVEMRLNVIPSCLIHSSNVDQWLRLVEFCSEWMVPGKYKGRSCRRWSVEAVLKFLHQINPCLVKAADFLSYVFNCASFRQWSGWRQLTSDCI